jgi:hypothetical protein
MLQIRSARISILHRRLLEVSFSACSSSTVPTLLLCAFIIAAQGAGQKRVAETKDSVDRVNKSTPNSISASTRHSKVLTRLASATRSSVACSALFEAASALAEVSLGLVPSFL